MRYSFPKFAFLCVALNSRMAGAARRRSDVIETESGRNLKKNLLIMMLILKAMIILGIGYVAADTGSFSPFQPPPSNLERSRLAERSSLSSAQHYLKNDNSVSVVEQGALVRLEKRARRGRQRSARRQRGGATKGRSRGVIKGKARNIAGRAANGAGRAAKKTGRHAGKHLKKNAPTIVKYSGRAAGIAIRVGGSTAGKAANAIVPGSGAALSATTSVGAMALETYTDNAFEGKEKIRQAYKQKFTAKNVLTEMASGALASVGPPSLGGGEGLKAGAEKGQQ